jgi:hypothetical protein
MNTDAVCGGVTQDRASQAAVQIVTSRLTRAGNVPLFGTHLEFHGFPSFVFPDAVFETQSHRVHREMLCPETL